MLRALLERGIEPDLVVGTSVGAINGAAIATDPTVAMASASADTWGDIEHSDVFAGSLIGRLATLARTRTHLHDKTAARDLDRGAPDRPDRGPARALRVRRGEHRGRRRARFTAGPLVDAVLASAAVPGLLPPVEVGGEHFIDGGIVNSIPVDRAVALGADRIFVMHVGRVDRPLAPPRWPWEVGLVAFEIARRHRFLGDLAALPESVELHVLPTGPARAAELQRPLRAALPRRRRAWERTSSAPTPPRARIWRSTACERACRPLPCGGSPIAPLVARASSSR